MRKIVIAGFLLMSSVASADDAPKNQDAPKTAKEQFEAVQKERRDAMHAFSVAYAKAKSPKEKSKVFSELYPNRAKYSGRYLQVAKDHPDDPVAVKALIEVVTLTRSGGVFTEALGILSKRHVKAEKIGQVCQRLVYAPSADTEKFLRQVLEKNPHHKAKGLACYSLARYRKQLVRMAEYVESQPRMVPRYEKVYGKKFMSGLKSIKPDEVQKEVEGLFVRVSKEFANIKSSRRTLGESAKSELFEIRHLSIGKVAPEIKGEDTDGVKFKLTDYRGKVIVLDFWGDW